MLSFVVCAGAQAYVFATWDQPHRLFLTGLFVVGVFLSAAISLIPVERIVRGPRKEWWFLGWSALDYVLVTAATVADGGPRSPFVFLFVLPTIFAALSYPLWSTLITAALGGLCFAGVAVSSNEANLEYDLFVVFSLLCAGALSSWQARNAGRARSSLTETVSAL